MNRLWLTIGWNPIKDTCVIIFKKKGDMLLTIRSMENQKKKSQNLNERLAVASNSNTEIA